MEKITIRIRKDGFDRTRPWSADVEFSDGRKWMSWMHGFRSKKSLLENIEAATPAAFEAAVQGAA